MNVKEGVEQSIPFLLQNNTNTRIDTNDTNGDMTGTLSRFAFRVTEKCVLD